LRWNLSVVLICISLAFPLWVRMVNISSCIYLVFALLLLRDVCLMYLSIYCFVLLVFNLWSSFI
jgi:hypothetical protein